MLRYKLRVCLIFFNNNVEGRIFSQVFFTLGILSQLLGAFRQSSGNIYHSAILDRFRDLHQDNDLPKYYFSVSASHSVMRSSCLPSRETYKVFDVSMFSSNFVFIQCAIFIPLLFFKYK